MSRNNVEHWEKRIVSDVKRASTIARKRADTCRTCDAEISYGQMRQYGVCETCREKHIAAWKEEHTRKPGDTRKGWLIGDECLVTIGKITYEAKIIDMSDVSRGEHDHDLMKLELTRALKGWDGKPITNKWTHPEPVQSYKLRKPLLKGEH